MAEFVVGTSNSRDDQEVHIDFDFSGPLFQDVVSYTRSDMDHTEKSAMSDERAIEQLQPLCEKSNTGLLRMTKNLEERGLLKAGKPRKRKASRISEQTNDA
jgi:hypothetical protein